MNKWYKLWVYFWYMNIFLLLEKYTHVICFIFNLNWTIDGKKCLKISFCLSFLLFKIIKQKKKKRNRIMNGWINRMNSHFIIIRFMFVKRSCFHSEITDKKQDLLSFFSSMFMILAFIHGCFSIVDLKMRIILLFHCKDKAKKKMF